MIEPQRAPVRPRVISPTSGDSVLLEDEILSLVERKVRGLVWLVGGPGSGKTTALSHVAAVLLASAHVALRDVLREDDEWKPSIPEGPGLIVRCGNLGSAPKNATIVYQLAPWTDDELIEYLLAVHRGSCHSVMRRWSAANEKTILNGNPELCQLVLAALAANEQLLTIENALRRVIDLRLPAGETRSHVSKWCLAMLQATAHSRGKTGLLGPVHKYHFQPEWNTAVWRRLLQHEIVMLLLATEQLAGQLKAPELDHDLEFVFPKDLIGEVAREIRSDAKVLARLNGVLGSSLREAHSTAASLLHAAGIGWRPDPPTRSPWLNLMHRPKVLGPRLFGAILTCAAWPGVELSRFELAHADLNSSDLTKANLDDAFAMWASFRGAQLTGASLERISAEYACLAFADLSYARATKAMFQTVNAQQACFEGAMLKDASFHGANLTGSRFARANLAGADLVSAEIEGADFSQVEFEGARLTGLVLCNAEFRKCSFRKAQMQVCNLEEMVLPGADFREVNLQGALLTGSVMPHADFRGANLINTGLAEIEWENADLRDANLRGASFHMGSSRSGLVDSPIASLGTRTGFYTDDYNEQDFKSPEEIRKANLRGADLRGANIAGVDFYLVDLRDALYDASQEQQLRSTGAILESRVL